MQWHAFPKRSGQKGRPRRSDARKTADGEFKVATHTTDAAIKCHAVPHAWQPRHNCEWTSTVAILAQGTSRAVASPRALCPMFDSWCGQACMQPILQPMKNDCLHESAQSLGQQNGFPPEWWKGMDAWAQRNVRLLAHFVAFRELCEFTLL